MVLSKNRAGSFGESTVLSKEHFKARELVDKASMAAAVFHQLGQEQVDRIVERACHAGFNARVKLAKMACEESGLGVWQDKVLKNVFATQFVHESIRHEPTVGAIFCDEAAGLIEIAEPVGPIFLKAPLSSPTSTVLSMILVALKTRNPLLVSPAPKTPRCCAEAVRICYEAALEAGAPEDCIQCLDESSREMDHAVMNQPGLAMIVALGRPDVVSTAAVSGTLAVVAVPDNVLALIDASADIPFAVKEIARSKTFDNGNLFACEQSVIVEEKIAAAVVRELNQEQAHFLAPDDAKKLAAVLFQDEGEPALKPEGIGQSAEALARMAGIAAPAGTRLLVARQANPGDAHPLARAKLAPVLSFHVRPTFEAAVNLCVEMNSPGGAGHIAEIFANDEEAVRAFSECMKAGMVMVNTPAALGAVGGILNRLKTSFLLGAGPGGKAAAGNSLAARHLLNIKRICRRRVNVRWLTFPKERFLDEGRTLADVLEEYNRNY